jgi:hypothetical protein
MRANGRHNEMTTTSYIGSLLEELFTGAQHHHLDMREKYQICLTLLHVHRDPQDLTQCCRDTDLWSRLLSAVVPCCGGDGIGDSIQWNKPLSQYDAAEVKHLYTCYHLAGHPACSRLYSCEGSASGAGKAHHYGVMTDEQMRHALSQATDAVMAGHCDTGEGGEGGRCEQYYRFHSLFTANFGASVRDIVEEYKEARCSHLCDRLASPLYRFQAGGNDGDGDGDKVSTFCSLQCRDLYVALLREK